MIISYVWVLETNTGATVRPWILLDDIRLI